MKLIRTMALAITLALLGCGEVESIKVGVVLPLTGGISTFGESTRDGALLAFEEVNSAGGVHGRPLDVLLADDANDKGKAIAAAARWNEVDKVTAILGSVSTGCSEPLAHYCQRAGVPMIAPSSTNPFVTIARDGTRRDFVFRACFTDSFQGAVAARFARGTMNSATAAVFYAADDEYSGALAQFFAAAFESLGGTVVATEVYDAATTDFAPALARVKDAHPDVLFLPGYYTEVGMIARAAWQLGLRAELLGGDGWDSPEMMATACEAVRGGYFTSHFSPDDPRPEVRDWVARFRARYGRNPDALAALGYDAARLLADAIGRAEPVGRGTVRDALAATEGFAGVTGTISFDDQGNPIKDAVILQYGAEGPAYVTTETP